MRVRTPRRYGPGAISKQHEIETHQSTIKRKLATPTRLLSPKRPKNTSNAPHFPRLSKSKPSTQTLLYRRGARNAQRTRSNTEFGRVPLAFVLFRDNGSSSVYHLCTNIPFVSKKRCIPPGDRVCDLDLQLGSREATPLPRSPGSLICLWPI